MNKFGIVKKKALKFFADANGCHDWDHTERVYNLCKHIGRIEGANINILSLSAVLHDIGRGEQSKSGNKVCHAEVGAKMAENLLSKLGYGENVIKKVNHCILAHRYRNKHTPESLEAKILFDADKLDSIGAVGLGRAFLFAGDHGAKLHNNKNIDIEKAIEYSNEDTAYREYFHKLRHIKDKLFTKEAKRIAKERHRFMEYFFDKLNREIAGEI